MIHRILISLATLCAVLLPVHSIAEPVKGVSLAHIHRRGSGYGSEECRQQLAAIKATGANWIAINDFAYMQSINDPGLRFERDGSMRREDIVRAINDAHAIGLKVLVKPHIWSRDFWNGDKWVGQIEMKTDAEWKQWFDNYTQYVLYNAQIAAETNADSLCVGVELVKTSGREHDWRALVAEVRKIYKGPICYSAEFQEWKNIAWWDAVDVIGITAYFPVAGIDSPDDATIRAGWAKVYEQLIPFAEKFNRTICFTEIGYTTSTSAAREPWSGKVVGDDEALQARLYRIGLEEASKRERVVGVFAWKWFTSGQWRRHEHADPFSIQDRPAVLEVLRRAWAD